MKNNSAPQPNNRRGTTALQGAMRQILHAGTSQTEIDGAVNGLRRLAGDDWDAFLKEHFGSGKKEKPEPAAPSFQAPSVLRKRAEELEAKNKALEDDIAQYKQGRAAPVKRIVEKAVKAKTASLNGRIDALTDERKRLKQHLDSVARRLHRELEGQHKSCPYPEHCPECRKGDPAGDTAAQEPVTATPEETAPETENRSETATPDTAKTSRPRTQTGKKPRRGNGRKFWTWERYRFLAEQKLRLMEANPTVKYLGQKHLDTLATICANQFNREFTRGSMIGALDRIEKDPSRAEPPPAETDSRSRVINALRRVHPAQEG